MDLDKLGRTQFMVQHQDGKFGHFAIEVGLLYGSHRPGGIPHLWHIFVTSCVAICAVHGRVIL